MTQSDIERGPEHLWRINKQGSSLALEGRPTKQQRPESPTVTLIWHASKYKAHKLHQRYIPSKGCPRAAHIPCISGTLGHTGVYRHKTEPIFNQARRWSLHLETGSTYKHTYKHLHVSLRVNSHNLKQNEAQTQTLNNNTDTDYIIQFLWNQSACAESTNKGVN